MYLSNNLFNNIKQQFNNLSTVWTVEILSYLLSGFIIGFLFKHTSKYIISLTIITLLSLWGLEHFDIITINYNYINNIIGLPVNTQLADITNQITLWMQNHVSQCIASGLGFYLALELA